MEILQEVETKPYEKNSTLRFSLLSEFFDKRERYDEETGIDGENIPSWAGNK